MGLIGASWLRFRAWRRSRPFWAGIFLLVAGAELLLIPLPMDSIGLIVHIGIGGISGILIGAVLMVAGLLLWFHPVQRMFYSIVAVLLAIAALVASNLGGFLIGTILGVVGGSLGFAWTPLPPGTAPRRLWRRGPTTPADTGTTDFVSPGGVDVTDPQAATAGAGETAVDASDATPTTNTSAEPGWGRLDPSWGAAASRHTRPAPYYRTSHSRGTVIGGNIFAALLSLVTFGLINLSPTPSPTQSADPPAAAATPTPTPSGSPAAVTSPSPAASPGSSPSASTTSGGGTTATAGPSPGASPSPSPSPTPTGTAPPFALSTAQSTLTASSVSMTGFTYDGVVSVPTTAGPVQMMQFSASTLDLNGMQLAVTQGGATMTTTASSLDFSGHVVLYATQLSGDLLGIPLTITPSTPLATILQLLGQAGVSQLLPLTMTNVTTSQPFTSADGMTASALLIS